MSRSMYPLLNERLMWFEVRTGDELTPPVPSSLSSTIDSRRPYHTVEHVMTRPSILSLRHPLSHLTEFVVSPPSPSLAGGRVTQLAVLMALAAWLAREADLDALWTGGRKGLWDSKVRALSQLCVTRASAERRRWPWTSRAHRPFPPSRVSASELITRPRSARDRRTHGIRYLTQNSHIR